MSVMKEHNKEKARFSLSDEKWTNRAGICERYRFCDRTLSNLMRDKVIPYVKIGKLVLFDVDACDQALREYDDKCNTQSQQEN